MNVHISLPDVYHGNRLYSAGQVDNGQALPGANDYGTYTSPAELSLRLIGGSGRLAGRAKNSAGSTMPDSLVTQNKHGLKYSRGVLALSCLGLIASPSPRPRPLLVELV